MWVGTLRAPWLVTWVVRGRGEKTPHLWFSCGLRYPGSTFSFSPQSLLIAPGAGDWSSCSTPGTALRPPGVPVSRALSAQRRPFRPLFLCPASGTVFSPCAVKALLIAQSELLSPRLPRAPAARISSARSPPPGAWGFYISNT